MRGFLFTVIYYVLSVLYVLTSLPFLILPFSSPVRAIIKSYTRAMNWNLRLVAGIKKDVRGKSNLPDGPFIIAAKHQSWGDGFLIYPEVNNLAFVTGDHLEKFPLVGGILRKLGAIVIDTCGGGERKAASLKAGMARAYAEGRRVLIYPEGHLAPVDYHFRYKTGVWHMQRSMNVPVVPVATNIGLFWRQQDMHKTPGTAVIEFLEPIAPGLSKSDFLNTLVDRVETATSELVAEGRGTAPIKTQLIPDPPKGMEARPTLEDLGAHAKP